MYLYFLIFTDSKQDKIKAQPTAPPPLKGYSAVTKASSIKSKGAAGIKPAQNASAVTRTGTGSHPSAARAGSGPRGAASTLSKPPPPPKQQPVKKSERESPKTQRLSLVQRQARFAANSSRPVLSRSATTNSISTTRSRPGGLGARQVSSAGTASTTAAAAATGAASAAQRLKNRPPQSSPSQALAAFKPSGSGSGGVNAHNVPPAFGSTSSISSSSSNRSWADTVKGLTRAPTR